MTDAPFRCLYNLSRLGAAGDEIAFAAGAEERALLARLADVRGVPEFAARVRLTRQAPNRFRASFALTAKAEQTCVVTLEPLTNRISREFMREIHVVPGPRRPHKGEAEGGEVVVMPEGEDGPEEVESPHYDLAGPPIEEFLLALDPYPRAPGVQFQPAGDRPAPTENPFAVLKRLKSGN